MAFIFWKHYQVAMQFKTHFKQNLLVSLTIGIAGYFRGPWTGQNFEVTLIKDNKHSKSKVSKRVDLC